MTHSGRTRGTSALRRLARSYGAQTHYVDLAHVRHEASTESLLAVLDALGVPLAGPQEAAAALAQTEAARAAKLAPPVIIAWDGRRGAVEVRPPAQATRLEAHLVLEDGTVHEFTARLDEAEATGPGTLRVRLPARVPLGYHVLHLEAAGREACSAVLAAPRRAFRQPASNWGVFLPVYAAWSARSWGAGDLGDLATLVEMTADLGGEVVGTLPVLAAFLGEPPGGPTENSPYAPASRLFWNEFFLDVEALPEFGACEEAQALVASPGLRAELTACRKAPLVEYERLMAAKRGVLDVLAGAVDALPVRRDAFDAFLRRLPAVTDYARFRAVGERLGTPWQQWPARLRDGTLRPGDHDPAVFRTHLYAQWATDTQLGDVAARARDRGVALYLDLPLGTHADAYDTWRYRELFANGASLGAPPDLFFKGGQDWGLPPLRPGAAQADGHRLFAAAVRHHLRHAGILRIDHVMGLHRVFWVPHGMRPRDGVYVRYPAEELYAVLTLESQRAGAKVIGENLGTVPGYVNRALHAHGLYGMYVAEFELCTDGIVTPPPTDAVVALDTHDTPTWAGFWEGDDIAERVALGHLDETDVEAEHKARRLITSGVRRALANRGLPEEAGPARDLLLDVLAASDAETVLVNIEDLWSERLPQNVPGTHRERPNWRRRARLSLEAIAASADVTRQLRSVDARRPTI